MTESAHPVRAPADEERALLESAVVVRRDDRARWLVSGPRAADVLNGLVTNDISVLTPGTGCYAAALTAKGKIIADLRIFALGDGFLVDAVEAAAPGFAAMLRKYVNPRMARVEDVTQETSDVAIAGPQASELLARAFGAPLPADVAAHSHVQLPLAGRVSIVARAAELEQAALDLIVALDDQARVFTKLTEAGAVPGSLPTWEAARIARGWPVWGRDMDESTLAQEAGLDRFNAISYTKGCYTGQETVARVHFRGHVNRYLRRARFEPGGNIPHSAEITVDDKVVGAVRSSAVWDREGVAIAMVRREIGEGASVTARGSGFHAPLRLID